MAISKVVCEPAREFHALESETFEHRNVAERCVCGATRIKRDICCDDYFISRATTRLDNSVLIPHVADTPEKRDKEFQCGRWLGQSASAEKREKP